MDFTLIFKLLDDLSLFGETLSPAILMWLKNRDGADKQGVLKRRMQRTVRHCRRLHFGAQQIEMQVSIDFMDLSEDERAKIQELIAFQLLPKIVIK